jgi:alpha-amylase
VVAGNYLKQALADKAAGFRCDSIQHIKLLKKYDGKFGSNFWPNVTANGASFQYGEICRTVAPKTRLSKVFECYDFKGWIVW